MNSDSELLRRYRQIHDWQHSVPMRWQPSLYEAIQWRKARERQGWLGELAQPNSVIMDDFSDVSLLLQGA